MSPSNPHNNVVPFIERGGVDRRRRTTIGAPAGIYLLDGKRSSLDPPFVTNSIDPSRDERRLHQRRTLVGRMSRDQP
jgi:hypothetical protein